MSEEDKEERRDGVWAGRMQGHFTYPWWLAEKPMQTDRVTVSGRIEAGWACLGIGDGMSEMSTRQVKFRIESHWGGGAVCRVQWWMGGDAGGRPGRCRRFRGLVAARLGE